MKTMNERTFSKELKFRFLSLEINGIKNVEHGYIQYDDNVSIKKGDFQFRNNGTLGIYGPNGTGKTAAVACFRLLKAIASDFPFESDSGLKNLVSFKSKLATVKYTFFIEDSNKEKYIVSYLISLKNSKNNNFFFDVCNESFFVKKYDESIKKYIRDSRRLSIDYVNNSYISDLESFSVKSLFGVNKEKQVNGFVEIKTILSLGNELHRFMAMSDKFISILKNSLSIEAKETSSLLLLLREYIRCHIYVHTTHAEALSYLGMSSIYGKANDEVGSLSGQFPLLINGPFDILSNQRGVYDNLLKQINVIVSSFIPGFSSSFKDYGERLIESKDNPLKPLKVNKIEMVRIVDGGEIPLSCESAGIRKFVNLAGALIQVFNHYSDFLVIDEIDSGVFEFLLGQVLKVMSEDGKGQILFTCHNLGPLETLREKNIYFTTLNQDNRYIKLGHAKPNNNIRDFYIRSLQIGGQKEEMYKETDSSYIARSLRIGGLIADGKEK